MKRHLSQTTINEIEELLFIRNASSVELKIESGKVAVIEIKRKLTSKDSPDRD